MSLLSLNFLAVIVGAKIALSLRLPAAAKTFILLLVSCAFALSYLSHFQFVALLAFCLFAYCAAVVSARKPSWIFSTLFSVWSLLGIYLYLKGYLKFLPNINKEVPAAGLAGLSYILFRVVLVHLEFTSKRLSPPSPVRYLLYLFYFPSFASGPVQAYPDFSAQLSGREKAPTAWVGPFFRVAMGLAKIYLISRWFDTAAEMLPKERLEGISIEALDVFLSISGICYFFHLYINFSGYMDVVVGISRRSSPKTFSTSGNVGTSRFPTGFATTYFPLSINGRRVASRAGTVLGMCT